MIYSGRHEQPDTFVKPLPWVYAHGELESFLSYDIVTTDSLETFCQYQDVCHTDTKTVRINNVLTQAKNQSGETTDVRLFMWWGDSTVRGLVVKADDADALDYAKHCFQQRAVML